MTVKELNDRVNTIYNESGFKGPYRITVNEKEYIETLENVDNEVKASNFIRIAEDSSSLEHLNVGCAAYLRIGNGASIILINKDQHEELGRMDI